MSHNNFKASDAQVGNTNGDTGDAHLSNAREEIGSSIGSQFVGTMRQDSSTGILPSGNVENSGSINFGPSDGHKHNGTTDGEQGTNIASNDGRNYQNTSSSYEQQGNHAAGDGHNHQDPSGVDRQAGNHSPGDGHSHQAPNRTAIQIGSHSDGDGDNHNGTIATDAQAANHSISDGHNHSASSNARSNLVNGDVAALNEQTRMSQDAAKLGLGARDIALMQQLEGSVPHSSSRELAERLKAARNRGGILDLSRHDSQQT